MTSPTTLLLHLSWAAGTSGQLFASMWCVGLGSRGAFTEVPSWCETELATERKLGRGTYKQGAFLCCPIWAWSFGECERSKSEPGISCCYEDSGAKVGGEHIYSMFC